MKGRRRRSLELTIGILYKYMAAGVGPTRSFPSRGFMPRTY